MSVQSRLDINTQSPFLSGSFKGDNGTYAQDAGETNPVVRMTVLGKVSASGKYKALVAAAVDGSQYPAAIYNGTDILAADIVAGDVEIENAVIGGDGKVNRSSVVFHNGADTLATLVDGRSLEAWLNDKGFFFQDVVDTEEFENA